MVVIICGKYGNNRSRTENVTDRVGVNSIPELELQVNSNSGIGIGIGIEIGGFENGIGIENPGIGIGIENRNWFFLQLLPQLTTSKF